MMQYEIVENIPNSHSTPEPLMEFGIYDDGILYDNLKKKIVLFLSQRK